MISLRRTFLIAVLLLAAASAITSPSPAQTRTAPPLLPLKVVGNRLLDAKNRPVWLRGVNAASMEWTSDGEGHILQTVKVAIREWKCNVVRVPLAQDRWFGKVPEQKDEGKAYRALVKQVVDTCASLGAYVILDLHWSNAGEWGQQIGQHSMPDRNSVAFWKECAAAYKNHPAVLFDLYNEPHDVTWDVWLNGGPVTESDRQRNYTKTYEAVGMQKLLDTVRATGARNVVVVGGLDWAYDMSGFLEGKALADRKGLGVIYANHNYPMKGDTPEQWVAKMKRAAAKVPILVGEFGAGGGFGRRSRGEQWVRQILQGLQDNKWHWTAWDLHVSAGPTLVSDWNYTPTPDFGVFVKQALAGTLPRYVATAETPDQAPAGPSVPQVAPAVLAKAIAALGGDEALSRIKAVSWKAKSKMTFGPNTSEVATSVVYQGLGSMRQEFEGEFGGNKMKGVTVLLGDKGVRVFGGNRTDMRADELASEKRSVLLALAPVLIVPLKGAGYTLASVADATVEGKPAAGVRVTEPDKKVFTLYFDKASGLPVRLVATVAGFMGQEFEQDTLYSDYRDAAGIKKAMKVVLKRDGQVFMEQQITEFKVLDTVDPKTFTETEWERRRLVARIVRGYTRHGHGVRVG